MLYLHGFLCPETGPKEGHICRAGDTFRDTNNLFGEVKRVGLCPHCPGKRAARVGLLIVQGSRA
jgi:hypothetical protein